MKRLPWFQFRDHRRGVKHWGVYFVDRMLRGSSDARHHLPNWNRARDAAATRWAGRSDLASLMRGLR